MSEDQSKEAGKPASHEVVREKLNKYVAAISDNRKIYFYTFGTEKLELPVDAVLTESSESAHV
jgi:hypothetical protein